jgi:hypothetical protein
MTGHRADKTGRSTGQFANGKFRRENHPPPKEPWIWFTRRMMESPAFVALGGGAFKIVSRVIVEHLAHGGTRNGALAVTYDDFMRFGIRRRSVLDYIGEAIALGWIQRTEAGRRVYGGFKGAPSLYGLTWLPRHTGEPASNSWQQFETDIEARAAVASALAALELRRLRERAEIKGSLHVRVVA